jgi:heme A synthase
MLKTPAGGQTALAGFEKKLTGNVPDDSEIPGSVRKAVRFILAGAATTAVLGIFLLIATIVNRNALTDSSGKKLSNTAFTSGVVGTIVTYAVLVAIWILMARLNRAGRIWARILASVFCALATLGAYQLINSLRGGQTITVTGVVYIVLALLYWLLGVIAIAMLWRPESTLYFRERTAVR